MRSISAGVERGGRDLSVLRVTEFDGAGGYVALLVVRDESHAREVVRRYKACTALPEPP